jgi:hypothetical protein
MTSDQEVEPKQLDTTHVHEEDVQEEGRGDDDEEEETAAASSSTNNVNILTNLGEHDGHGDIPKGQNNHDNENANDHLGDTNDAQDQDDSNNNNNNNELSLVEQAQVDEINGKGGPPPPHAVRPKNNDVLFGRGKPFQNHPVGR